MKRPPDPGYGDPNAPVGTPEWAKRWRLGFQGVAKDLPHAPERARKYYEIGVEHRAWTMLRDEKDKPFATFDAFCAERDPYGLGIDPAMFHAYLSAELRARHGPKKGGRLMDLITVSPGDDKGGRPAKGEETCSASEQVSGRRTTKEAALRAILRAPEVIQDLYRDGLVTQADAAAMGPKSPTPETAAKVAEARQAVERLPRPSGDLFCPPEERKEQRAAYKADVKRTIRRVLGKADPTPLDRIKAAWQALPPTDREAFLAWLCERQSLITTPAHDPTRTPCPT